MKKKEVILLFILCIVYPLKGNTQSKPDIYKIKRSDYFIAPVAIALGLTMKYGIHNDVLTKDEISNLTLDPVFNIDHVSLNKYNSGLDKAGNWMTIIPLSAPLILSMRDWKGGNRNQAFAINFMYAEVIGLTFGITELTKNLTHRIRPYMYNTELSIDERYEMNDSGDSEKSFYSMHTAFAFSSATFLSKVYTDCYGKSTQSKWIWAGSLTFATAIGVSRIYSGQHFPTDVIMGALVGGLTGYIIPVLHKNKNSSTTWLVSPNGIRIIYRI